MSMLAVGVDLGTSGVRSAVIDGDGAVVSMATADYGTTPESRSDPDCWWQAVCRCLTSQIATLRDAGHTPDAIKGIAVDGTSGSLLLTDAGLRPVTRALMYHDGGFDDEAARIALHAPDPHITRGSNSALARALRLIAEDNDGQAAHLLHQADFIVARLRGGGAVSDVNNALKTGCDPVNGTWPDWMTELIPQAILPKLVLPGEETGSISFAVASDLGLPAHTVLHAGTTDSIAAFLAATSLTPGAAVTSIGTTLAIKLYSQKRIDAPEMGLYAHRLGGGWLVGGASNTGGGVLKAFFNDDELVALSKRIEPNQKSGFDYYPLLEAGERFPINDPALQPRLTPRPKDDVAFLHGIFEGIARIEAKGYGLLAERGCPFPKVIFTSGGGSKNTVLTQIRSLHIGVEIKPALQTEACIGTARLAMNG
ncbi:FGGY-family carbohydrate kinase [Cognatiyoonia sp. IB215182]|uniref:FGGY-family carbohydrate kinase n=1 Tax=Cognatiyoonia sp. IB215182 TaxID=3097353 RepID=UPI002A0B8930|nr:FGGY-family carbohydrate kinase [Cognatiyoonia sp. IB215182]MDX8355218.1 FGGY-family carbohydrate kinase [Cognatiyoonia sp. IB215182]